MRRLTVDQINENHKRKGVKLVDEIYLGNREAHKWACENGHEWFGISSKCRECSVRPIITIEKVKDLARKMGGVCFSEEYVNPKGKLNFQCGKGHKWIATYDTLYRGCWCPYCAGQKGITLETLKEVAASKGGFCISDSYMGIETKHRWKCAHGHEWEAKPSDVKTKTWCPICPRVGASLGERTTRYILEMIFNDHFPKARPKWLNGMEFDGYSSKLNMAFEYHGEQHYRPIKMFGGEEAFEKLRRRDISKLELAKINNVKVIVVPTFKNDHDLQLCIDQIESSVADCGIKIPEWSRPRNLPKLNIPINKIMSDADLEKIFALAKKNGGKVLSTELRSSSDKIMLECSKGHVWGAVKGNLLQFGTWCLPCSYVGKKNGRKPNKNQASFLDSF